MRVVMLGNDSPAMSRVRMALEYIKTGADVFGDFASMKEAEYVLGSTEAQVYIEMIKKSDPTQFQEVLAIMRNAGLETPPAKKDEKSGVGTGLLIGGGLLAAFLAFKQ